MEAGNSHPNDMAPHAGIIQISWEIHEKKQDGSFYGSTKAKGKSVIVLQGNDLAITQEYVNALIDLIKENTKNVSEFKVDEERLRQAHIQRSGGSWDNNSEVFSMRGRIGKDSSSGPATSDIV